MGPEGKGITRPTDGAWVSKGTVLTASAMSEDKVSRSLLAERVRARGVDFLAWI
jgi:hypothetical protein